MIELALAYRGITHDIGTIRAIADEVVLMTQGEIVDDWPKNRHVQPAASRRHPTFVVLGA